MVMPLSKLGIKVGGLLRHDFAGSGHAHHQVDIDRIEQKGDLRSASVDGIERRGSFALVGKICFRRNGVGSDAEDGFQNALVQEHDVEFAL